MGYNCVLNGAYWDMILLNGVTIDIYIYDILWSHWEHVICVSMYRIWIVDLCLSINVCMMDVFLCSHSLQKLMGLDVSSHISHRKQSKTVWFKSVNKPIFYHMTQWNRTSVMNTSILGTTAWSLLELDGNQHVLSRVSHYPDGGSGCVGTS